MEKTDRTPSTMLNYIVSDHDFTTSRSLKVLNKFIAKQGFIAMLDLMNHLATLDQAECTDKIVLVKLGLEELYPIRLVEFVFANLPHPKRFNVQDVKDSLIFCDLWDSCQHLSVIYNTLKERCDEEEIPDKHKMSGATRSRYNRVMSVVEARIKDLSGKEN